MPKKRMRLTAGGRTRRRTGPPMPAERPAPSGDFNASGRRDFGPGRIFSSVPIGSKSALFETSRFNSYISR